MSTRRDIYVPDGAATVGKTNRFLKLPFAAPQTPEQHAANMREIERWGNRIPLGGEGADCCTCWHIDPTVYYLEVEEEGGVNLGETFSPFPSLDPPEEVAPSYYKRTGLTTTISGYVSVPYTADPGERVDWNVQVGYMIVAGGVVVLPYAPNDTTGALYSHHFTNTYFDPYYDGTNLDVIVEAFLFDKDGDQVTGTYPYTPIIEFELRHKLECMIYYETPGEG